MQKPIKPKKPTSFVFPPQNKFYSEECHWGADYRGGYYEDPIEKAMDTWDGENPEEHWKECCLSTEGKISLAEALKIAKEKGITPEDMYFGLVTSEDYISASLFSIKEDDNPHYEEMVEEAEEQERKYQRELARYEKEMKEYPLKMKQYLERQKADAEQKLRELERE